MRRRYRITPLRLLIFQGASEDFRDVFDLDLLFGLDTLDAILEHGDAEGTGGSNHFGLRVECLVYARLIDALARLLFHPGATTAAATAEASVAVTPHLGDAIAIDDVQDATWLIIHIVVASDVARVVIGHATPVETCR